MAPGGRSLVFRIRFAPDTVKECDASGCEFAPATWSLALAFQVPAAVLIHDPLWRAPPPRNWLAHE